MYANINEDGGSTWIELGIALQSALAPEWRNGRRRGLKIPRSLRACGFKSHLRHHKARLADREARLNREEFEEILAHLSPEEVPEILRVIGILEKNGGATPDEAEEYRRRVRAWAAYYGFQDET